MPFHTSARVSNPFSFLAIDATDGPNSGHARRGPHVVASMSPLMDNQVGPHAFRCYRAPRPESIGHGIGPYSRSISVDPSAGQHNRPSVNLVGFGATGNASVQHHGVS